jgi:hypothetical protein
MAEERPNPSGGHDLKRIWAEFDSGAKAARDYTKWPEVNVPQAAHVEQPSPCGHSALARV